TRITTVEHEVAYPFGMAYRICNGNRSALRDAEQRKTLDADCVHHGFQIAHPGIEGELRDIPIRQPASALVIANESMPARKLGEPMAPDRAAPIVLEVRQPVGNLDEGR